MLWNTASQTSRFVKLYGLERSGTNYLEWVLRRAFDNIYLLVDETGWKHGEVPEAIDWSGYTWSDPTWADQGKKHFASVRLNRLKPFLPDLWAAVDQKQIAYCYIVKNPYAWVDSFARYTHQACSPVSPALIQHWNGRNRHYLSRADAAPESGIVIRYEDLLEEPNSVVDRIAERFGIPRQATKRFSLQNAMTEIGRPGKKPFDPHFYRDARYMHSYSPDDLQQFALHLDPELLTLWDYRSSKLQTA